MSDLRRYGALVNGCTLWAVEFLAVNPLRARAVEVQDDVAMAIAGTIYRELPYTGLGDVDGRRWVESTDPGAGLRACDHADSALAIPRMLAAASGLSCSTVAWKFFWSRPETRKAYRCARS